MWTKWISRDHGAVQPDWSFGGCRVISLVGGGGKTTMLDFLARTGERAGNNVLVTTSTHLQIPHGGNLAFSVADLHRLWMDGSYAVIGTLGSHRISMPEEAFLEEAAEQADLILIEADGAKRMPCKIPIETEPVILEDTDLVLAVLGMSAVGRPIREVCFRLEAVVDFLGKTADEPLTEEDAARILSSEAGSRKGVQDRAYTVVLNQCDTPQRKQSAERIAGMLLDRGVADVVLTAFPESERHQFEEGMIHE